MGIKKRSGDIAKFDVGKIGAAMRKALAATGIAVKESRMDELSLSVQHRADLSALATRRIGETAAQKPGNGSVQAF